MSTPNINYSNLDSRYTKPTDLAAAIATQATTDAGQYPSIATALTNSIRGNTIAWIGDSITAGSIVTGNLTATYLGDAFAVYAGVYSGQRLVSTGYYGVPGDTTAQMLTRVQSALSGDPAFLHILGGTNDIGQGISASQTDVQIISTVAEGLAGLCNAAKAAGSTPILGTIPPNNTGGQRQRVIMQANAWIRRYAVANRILLIDYYSILVAGGSTPVGSGNYKTNYSIDGTHPSPLAAALMGQLIWSTLAPYVTPYTPPLCTDLVDASQIAFGYTTTFYLMYGPLFMNSTSHANLPDGTYPYTGNFSPTGTTYSIITNPNVPGKMLQIVQASGSSLWGVQVGLVNPGTVIGGNRYFLAGMFSTDGGVNIYVQITIGDATYTPLYASSPGNPINVGTYGLEFIAPGTGSQTCNVNLLVGAGTGTVSFGYPSLIDLTVSGII